MLRKLLSYTYIIITSILLIIGYIFEESYGFRRYTLFALCTIFIVTLIVNVVLDRFLKNKHWVTVSQVLLVVLLFSIELNSKYAVNYFFHTLFLVLVFYSIIVAKSKNGILISVLATLLSFYKFIELILVTPSFSNISLLVFFGSFQILMVTIGIFLNIYQEETKKTKGLYNELLEAHDQLKVYSNEIKQLTRIEAKTNIARDLHDTLGHEMTGLIMQMEMATQYFEKGDELKGKALLDASKESARHALKSVRTIVETLKSDDDDSDTTASYKKMIDDFSEKTGCHILFEEKNKMDITPNIHLVLYRVIQESLTNAIRHGKAKMIQVSVIYKPGEVILLVDDDGMGCDDLIIGNGLNGIKERLEQVGGSAEFCNKKGNSGFVVKGFIPLRSHETNEGEGAR